MQRQLPLVVALVAVFALVSEPLYLSLSWRGGLPDDYRRLTELAPDREISASLTLGQVVQYVLRARRGEGFTVEAKSQAFDAFLRVEIVRDSVAALVATDDDGGEGRDSRLELCAESTAVFIVGVSALGNMSAGTYRVSGRRQDGDCVEARETRARREAAEQRRLETENQARRDSGFAAADRGTIPASGTTERSGDLGFGDPLMPDGRPHESYRFECRAGLRFRFEMFSSDFDAYAIVEDPMGNRVAYDDDSGGNRDARLSYTCAGSGTYRLVATRFGSASMGSYRIRVTMEGSGVIGGRPGPPGRPVSPVNAKRPSPRSA